MADNNNNNVNSDFTIDVDYELLPKQKQTEILDNTQSKPLKLFEDLQDKSGANRMLGIKKYAANNTDNTVSMVWTLESNEVSTAESTNSDQGIFRPSTIHLRGETFPITSTNTKNNIYSFVRPVESDVQQEGGAIRPISKTRYAKRKWNKKRKQTKNKRQRMNRK